MNLPFNYSMLITAVVVMPVLLLVLRFVALKAGLVDVPNARKIHSNSIPLVGGLALFIMAAVLLLMTKNVNSFGFYLMLGSGLVMVVGLLDDLYQLSALWRFTAQILASLVLIYFANVQIESFGYLLLPQWELYLGYAIIPVTVFGVVGVINALNMSDGIDGLAAMTFFLPVCTLALLTGDSRLRMWLLLLLVCVMIFVLFNRSRTYKIFLGDSGSMFLGFVLAWLLVYFSQGQMAIIKPVTALYFVALPVYDTIFVMLRRMVAGSSPFKPDNTHLHHLFLARGYSQTKALLVMIILQSVFILLGLLLLFVHVKEYQQFYLFVGLSISYYFFMRKKWSSELVKKENND